MKKRIIVVILMLAIYLFPFEVFAEDSYSVYLSCPSVVSPNGNVTCELKLDNTNFTINKLTGNYSVSGITLSNSNLYIDNVAYSTSGTISNISFNIPENASSNTVYTLSLNSLTANDSISTNNISTSFRVISNDNTLKNISASGGTLVYNSNSDIYEAIIENSKTTISCEKNDEHASIKSGTGEVNLSYGSNEFIIEVLSESNESKRYKLLITRPDYRGKNTNLSSLIISNTNFTFDKNKTQYDLSTNSSSVIISATKEDTKSTVSGDTGKKTLNYGLNKFAITVTAENLSTKTYYINITRNDTRSNNNYLKSITLSDGTINFNKSTTTYNITVKKSIEKLKINAILDDSKSTFVNGYGPKDIDLQLGNNTVYLKVQNEKGEIRTYTLNINRDDGRDSDSSLKSLKISAGEINFDKDTYNYKINVEYKVQKIKIDAQANSETSKVKIEGDNYLKVGKNTFKIIVEAENGAKSTYVITVNRKKEGYELSSNNYVKELKIKGVNINFKKDVSEYTIETRKSKLNIDVKLDNKKATYKIIGNENLKEDNEVRIRVTAENGDVRDYVLLIKRPSNVLVLSIIFTTTLLAASLIYFVILRIKKRKSLYSNKVEIIDEDFL